MAKTSSTLLNVRRNSDFAFLPEDMVAENQIKPSESRNVNKHKQKTLHPKTNPKRIERQTDENQQPSQDQTQRCMTKAENADQL